MKFAMQFRAENDDGVLLYSQGPKGIRDYFMVALENRKIVVRYVDDKVSIDVHLKVITPLIQPIIAHKSLQFCKAAFLLRLCCLISWVLCMTSGYPGP